MSPDVQRFRFSPQARRTYWADVVTPAGRQIIDTMRRTRSRVYAMYADDGYYAVEDVPEQTKGIFNDLKPYQRRIAMGWAAQSRIARMEEEDMHRGISREYVTVDGAARPRRGRKWREISQAEHIRWQPGGITILTKDLPTLSVVDQAAATTGMPVQFFEQATVQAYT